MKGDRAIGHFQKQLASIIAVKAGHVEYYTVFGKNNPLTFSFISPYKHENMTSA